MATVILARIDRRPDRSPGRTRTLQWSNAGHLPPVVLHLDGRTELPQTERNDLLLGVDPTAPRRDHLFALPDGATLLLYTDGLIERRTTGIDRGLADLRAALSGLAHASLDELCDTVLDRLAPQAGEDDIAMLAVRGVAPTS